jgi:hypothetical protein
VITVKATREGLIGKTTASGYVIDTIVPFVALPAEFAIGKHVEVRNPLNGKSCIAVVLDIGPWRTQDYAYVLGGARPVAESMPATNGAGIDLGEKVWALLGMTDNTNVSWRFIDPS